MGLGDLLIVILFIGLILAIIFVPPVRDFVFSILGFIFDLVKNLLSGIFSFIPS